MSIKVFDQTYEALSRALDLRTQNQTVIASNIANSDTPGYQAQ
ncbi:MAG: flagellar basal body rod protein FlgB, partial [Bdellovibrionota bacterium]